MKSNRRKHVQHHRSAINRKKKWLLISCPFASCPMRRQSVTERNEAMARTVFVSFQDERKQLMFFSTNLFDNLSQSFFPVVFSSPYSISCSARADGRWHATNNSDAINRLNTVSTLLFFFFDCIPNVKKIKRLCRDCRFIKKTTMNTGTMCVKISNLPGGYLCEKNPLDVL